MSNAAKLTMTSAERRATAGLASIFGLRMLGLFLILPVFAIHGDALAGATPLLIGVAIGAYGLTQAILQIPMGYLSDRVGRRPVIVGGLVLFVAGSVLAAVADDIATVILGRALQGGGAIAAAVMALAADLVRPQVRTRAMAGIGVSVGAAFLLALIAGPLLAAGLGLSGVFWVTGAMALTAMLLLYLVVPAGGEPTPPPGRSERKRLFLAVVRDRDLLRLDLGILVLHAILTAVFVVLPLILVERLGVASADHWQVYVPVLLLSVVGMVPIILLGERRGAMHRVMVGVIGALGLALLVMSLLPASAIWLLAGLWLFFTAFNTLEATLPSLVSRFAPGAIRGAALGVYSTAQFMGAFLGGVLGGAMHGAFGVAGVFAACALLAALWALAATGLRSPTDEVIAECGGA